MDREELIKILDGNFLLTHWQDKEKSGSGYRLSLRASWNFTNLDVRYIQVQLVGIDPLTGVNIANENLTVTFSFDQKQCQIKRLLAYHGKFSLRCTAVLGAGQEVVFRNQEIMLECPESRPKIEYSVKESQGFRLVEIRSNCWGNCRGKVWITIDGHDQRINVPAGTNNIVRFYMSGAGKVGGVKVQDRNVILRQER